MRAPAFWCRERPGLAAFLLSPVGAVAGALTSSRMARTGTSVAVPVICIGNPVVGGAGKTPTALAIADILFALGAKPAFVSRGYGGRLTGPVRVDRADHDASAVGDEPLLLARRAPTYVARDRLAGARLAAAEGATVIVLDDGFQNPSLRKDLSLLVVDAASGVGNNLCLPAGPLRAPLDDQIDLCQGMIIIGRGTRGERVAAAARSAGKAVFAARLVPDDAAAERLRGKPVVAFAGLGRPGKFRATLEEVGAEIKAFYALGDHSVPSPSQAAVILSQAHKHNALVVATEKDVVKLTDERALAPLKAAALALPVALKFQDDVELRRLLASALASEASGQVR